jgi:hypothetical protein
VTTQYDKSLDPRPDISVRIDLADKSSIVDNYRAAEDPGDLLEDLGSKYGFPFPNPNQYH